MLARELAQMLLLGPNQEKIVIRVVKQLSIDSRKQKLERYSHREPVSD
jgi:hypothetical protein